MLLLLLLLLQSSRKMFSFDLVKFKSKNISIDFPTSFSSSITFNKCSCSTFVVVCLFHLINTLLLKAHSSFDWCWWYSQITYWSIDWHFSIFKFGASANRSKDQPTLYFQINAILITNHTHTHTQRNWLIRFLLLDLK